jgi:DNA-binding FadR family transcriptional regulator
MAFETIRRSSAPEMVAEQIINKIAGGELAPGSRLPAQRTWPECWGWGGRRFARPSTPWW